MLDCILKEARKQSQMINDAYKLAMSENYSDWMQASYLFDTIKNNERSRENN